MRSFIIDCDTAEDDVASIFLLAKNNMKIVGVTVVEGNIDFDQEIINALWALEKANVDAPVFPGSRRPIVKDFTTVEEVHGKYGLGEIHATTSRKPSPKHAAQAIIDASKELEGKLEILAISPLTNLAMAYLLDPSLPKRVKKVWVMGGTAFAHGNITPVAEYNFWVDPDAARIVFKAGFNITMVPWDVVTEYTINDQEWNEILNMKTPLSEIYVKMFSHYRKYDKDVQKLDGHPHPDLITTAVAINQDIVEKSKHEFVIIDNSDSLTRGMTLIDHLDSDKPWSSSPNTEIIYRIKKNILLEMIKKMLS
ncbi:nucleoside hydrolase [Sulfuracidifex tepidarius]|uniref:Pyrimidine-specific ribonucleoside hydrolase RihA n=1 Tax=Sulfuracidifex tepidarius TaxID=1294262 RepID=A0A510DVU8_9CREN|nr:nucleoside hydrolase [Sulfuracidifex tepidarius]BBG24342.1 Pyrimidine-specific ribonucleoside hydrolase RihA [Sulfuracidifex tepidarius]BBG27099.1 Pyrimidine-specific ribonucleoside hydrolase RihA [Sulfuracidifex tepidarius]